MCHLSPLGQYNLRGFIRSFGNIYTFIFKTKFKGPFEISVGPSALAEVRKKEKNKTKQKLKKNSY